MLANLDTHRTRQAERDATMKLLLLTTTAASLIAGQAYADQIEVSGHDILSIGDHRKILNNTVFACKMASDPAVQ
jgi:hypothetical protein